MLVNMALRSEVQAKNKAASDRAKAEGRKKVHHTKYKAVVLLGTEYANTRLRYLGHIARCATWDPLWKATCKGKRIKGNYHRGNRVGRPRLAWFTQAARAAWIKIRPKLVAEGQVHFAGTKFDENDRAHRKALKQYAIARKF